MNRRKHPTLRLELEQFTGSEQIFAHPLFKRYVYTEGVRYLAREGGCYWLIETIFSHQLDETLKSQPFQLWNVTVHDDESAIITVEDGNDHQLKQIDLVFTDFPLNEFPLWLVENTLLLPSEY